MHGLGNDFVVIDAINQNIELTPEQIKKLSDRHFGIGFDQLLLVEKPVSQMPISNIAFLTPMAEKLHNVAMVHAAFARFVRDKGLSDKDEIRVDTNSGQLLLLFADDDQITVNMGDPQTLTTEIPLAVEQEALSYKITVDAVENTFGAVSMGNPHAVLQIPDVNPAPVFELGKHLGKPPLFSGTRQYWFYAGHESETYQASCL